MGDSLCYVPVTTINHVLVDSIRSYCLRPLSFSLPLMPVTLYLLVTHVLFTLNFECHNEIEIELWSVNEKAHGLLCVFSIQPSQRGEGNWQETLADYRFSFSGNIMYYELYKYASSLLPLC